MQTIIELYNKGLETIPAVYRLPLAIIILVFLVIALVNFMRKNLLWVVVFILLLPAAWPALKQVGKTTLELIQKIPK
ncbi:MAG: hypothetical protein OEV37_02580 [Candidatus Berkelbacteria bacterium]|nr:hypothetical protein [Candidatus Berkelbacteria bacterium]